MRDVERIAEKIQFALDRRQVVSIVLGSTVLLGVVFYLGVVVGKDLAQGEPQQVAESLDDLDREAERLARQLTFPETLTAEAAPEAPSPIAAAEARGEGAAARAREQAEREKAEREKAEREKAEREREEKERLAREAARREEEAARQVAAAPPEVPAAPPAAPVVQQDEGAPTFTVQVGAMPTREEADALVASLRARGLAPYVVEADVPGKGFFYRVRLGRFGSRDEANRYLRDLQREADLAGFVAQAD